MPFVLCVCPFFAVKLPRYNILYDDGDREENVAPPYVRPRGTGPVAEFGAEPEVNLESLLSCVLDNDDGTYTTTDAATVQVRTLIKKKKLIYVLH